MTCAEYREYTSAWFDGEVSDAAFEELVGHVHHCETCRSFLSRLPRQAAMLRVIPGAGSAFASLEHAGAGEGIRKASAFSTFNAPLAVAAGIILIIMTLAVESNLAERSSEREDQWSRPALLQQPVRPQ